MVSQNNDEGCTMKTKRILAMLVRMDERLERAAEINEDLHADIEVMSHGIASHQTEIDDLIDQCDKLHEDNGRLVYANQKMSDELAEKQTIIDMIKADHEKLRISLQDRLDEMVKLATAAHNERDALRQTNNTQADTIRTLMATHPNYALQPEIEDSSDKLKPFIGPGCPL